MTLFKEVIIINGGATTGKDTFCELCNKHINCHSISTVDVVKKVYKMLGWNGEKTEVHRKGLSDIKDLSTKNLDHPYQYIKSEINMFRNYDDTNCILFIHSREPNEIQRFVNDFGCKTLLITNPRVDIITTNHADAEVANYNYDYVINNWGTLKEFEDQAVEFIIALKRLNQKGLD